MALISQCKHEPEGIYAYREQIPETSTSRDTKVLIESSLFGGPLLWGAIQMHWVRVVTWKFMGPVNDV